ncbi:MAG: Rne/Rng family ribonuclease [Paludibacteraceae bacterium]|nr:Rne/Rng family ribonuclease [Paludibacteraceae bacterium]
MNSELIIDANSQEICIALLEDKKLVEIHKETKENSFSVGNIYLGKIKKIMPGLNAAFVDVGYSKDAFLHYQDLGSFFTSFSTYSKKIKKEPNKTFPIQKETLLPEIDKKGSISNVLSTGQEIPVQILKEPISTKGPRLTTEISIAGRYLILIPFGNKISVSTKIASKEERNRLRQLVTSITPKNFGVIIRTVAEGKMVAELDNELRILVKRWEDTIGRIQKSTAPRSVLTEIGSSEAILRDLFNSSFQNICVNNEELYGEIRDYVGLIAPDQQNIVNFHKEGIPIFDKFDITKQAKSAFRRIVPFKSGSYLIIEHTEALHVIDVNSGNRSISNDGQETTAIEVNMAAADEIATQLRLRDMGGIIVIDFIDMNLAENRQKLYDHMRQIMKADRAKHNILPLTKFGLMQITRQRVRPEMHMTTTETCPTCNGTGKAQPSILFVDQLEKKIAHVVNDLKVTDFTLYIHPYVYAYINQGFFSSIKRKWKRHYGRKITILPMQDLPFLSYKFIDKDKQEFDPDTEI